MFPAPFAVGEATKAKEFPAWCVFLCSGLEPKGANPSPVITAHACCRHQAPNIPVDNPSTPSPFYAPASRLWNGSGSFGGKREAAALCTLRQTDAQFPLRVNKKKKKKLLHASPSSLQRRISSCAYSVMEWETITVAVTDVSNDNAWFLSHRAGATFSLLASLLVSFPSPHQQVDREKQCFFSSVGSSCHSNRKHRIEALGAQSGTRGVTMLLTLTSTYDFYP